MIHLPEYLHQYQKEAEKHLSSQLVGDIEFSGSTYQIQVTDPKSHKECWTFLQLNDKGELKDSFCSCEEGELSYCLHIAIAYLSIFNDKLEPLHIRFQKSLWNTLCHIYAEKLGVDSSGLEKISDGFYEKKSVSGKAVFSIEGRTEKAKAFLKKIIEERQEETEETSLKFSNISEEEVLMWREGRPSFQLSYELSYWRDIASWLMQLQEKNQPYSIEFNYSKDDLPNRIYIEFNDVKLYFYLSQANLPALIPSLETVNSPLKVVDSRNFIESMTYDKNTAEIHIHTRQDAKESKNLQNGKVIENWILVPGEGFYAQAPNKLIKSTILNEDKIEDILDTDYTLISNFLKNTEVHPTPIPASYSISFDPDWNLHITCYVFNHNDLIQPFSHSFGDWVYIEGEGFYRLTNKRFNDLEKIIFRNDLSEFIRQERSWLSTQEGFQTHVASVEAQFTYTLTKDNKLSFQRLLSTIDKETETKDFGSWVYIAGRGFYPKNFSHIGLSIQPDTIFNANQIPLFIHINQEDLKHVAGFFSSQCPVNDMMLNIELLDDDTIDVNPEYEPLPKYKNKHLKFFDDYVYVEGEGFHELPKIHSIPERFHHTVHVDKDNIELFLGYELPNLWPFVKHIDERLIPAKNLTLETTNLSKDESYGKGWYLLNLNYRSDHGSVPISTLWNALKKKKRFVFTQAGLIDLEDKRFHWLKLLPKTRIDKSTNEVLMPTFELLRLNAFDEIDLGDKKSTNYFQTQLLLKEITDFKPPSEPVIDGLKCELRPYQDSALKWLWFLYNYNLSGLLCDDMGLGKTHQTMALFASIQNEFCTNRKQERCHFLVICPTSVLFHWQEKMKKFLPDMKVFTYYGNQRSLEGFTDHDILLTSYGIWRIDEEILKEVVFEVAVFDEIQIAKNHQSKVYSSLQSANSKMRIGLTGTPIENHLRELKALFDLVIPGYMPRDSEYRELFIKPIERESDPKKRDLLTRFIKPFVLRRKKEDVLPELPEKTEEVIHCELHPDQQHLYNEVLIQSRQAILQKLHDNEEPIPYVHIFSILASLKQICNHPATFLKTPQDYKTYSSGKWELFVELINEARESKQKVVVFTQYLFMLDIFELYLNELGVGFATIRGATTQRGEQLHRFNHDPDCEIFLGSLQAAGLGVDLTAGSVVIHYDRWWNAARENQATDRVHRIGQTRGVQVFKLVTQGTFEERIDAIITRKGKLMEEVVGVDEREIVKTFNRDEIIELLQLVGEKE